MKLRFKNESKDGIIRIESSGSVKEVLINENLMNPSEESISICFRGKNSSGIMDLSPEEIGLIYESVKSRLPLIKEFKRLSGGGAKIAD